ncbi:ferredoxin-like protein, partial [Chloroflexota bacterium]
MHHTLRFYGKHVNGFLRLYMLLAGLTRVPVLGLVVRWLANSYGNGAHSGFVLTLEEAERIVDAATSIALGPCSCRRTFVNCDNPMNVEILVGLGAEVFAHIGRDGFEMISRESAKEILQLCYKGNLVHTLVRCRGDFYAICNCCSCCCVPLRLRRNYGIGYALVR